MCKVLIISGSREGHTTKICNYLGQQINALLLHSYASKQQKLALDFITDAINKEPKFTPISQPRIEIDFTTIKEVNEKELMEDYGSYLNKYDAIICGASVHYGHFSQEFKQFSKENAEVLNNKNSYFFAVNLTARKEDKRDVESNPYVKKWISSSIWKPTKTYVFAGALNYSQLSFFDKHIVRFIMKITKGDTDLKTKKVYTDWQDVDKLAKDIVNNIINKEE